MADGLVQAATLKASVNWKLQKAQTGFVNTFHGDESQQHTAQPAVGTYQYMFLARYSLAASGTQVVDLRTFTDFVGNSVTAGKIIGFMLKMTGSVTGGILQIETDPTNGLVFPFLAVGDALSIPVGTDGACLMICAGTAATIDATHKEWLLTNSGTQTIVVFVYAVVGT